VSDDDRSYEKCFLMATLLLAVAISTVVTLKAAVSPPLNE